MSYVDVEGMRSAGHSMNGAAGEMRSAASSMHEAIHEMKQSVSWLGDYVRELNTALQNHGASMRELHNRETELLAFRIELEMMVAHDAGIEGQGGRYTEGAYEELRARVQAFLKR